MLLYCAYLLFALALQAQPTLSLADAVRRAAASHPLLTGSAQRVGVSTGLLRQASLRRNPTLTVQTENWRFYGTPSFQPNEELDHFATLTQSFEIGGKRNLRMEASRAALRHAELERELVARQIALRVRQAYWNALAAQKIHELWLETARNFGQVVDYHEIRVREGAMAEADLLKVQLEGERLALSAGAAALEADRSRILLFREMGQTEFPLVQFTEDLGAESQLPAGGVKRALEERTEVKLARQAVTQARANLELERALARPNVDVMLGYKRTLGFHTFVGGVNVPLPFANRNQGNIEAAEAQVRAAEADLAAAEALVRAEVAAAESEVRMRLRQTTGLLRGSLDRANESARIAQAAYREGGADLLRLLDAERVHIELEVLYFRAMAEYRQSIAALEAATGAGP